MAEKDLDPLKDLDTLDLGRFEALVLGPIARGEVRPVTAAEAAGCPPFRTRTGMRMPEAPRAGAGRRRAEVDDA